MRQTPLVVWHCFQVTLCFLFFQQTIATARAEDRLAHQAIQLLRIKCVSCHGPDQAEGGLRLDSVAALRKGGERGTVISGNSAADSLLYQCVAGLTAEELRMPPKNPLSQTEIALLQQWIQAGSPWSETDSTPKPMNAAARSESSSHELIGDAWSDPRNPIVKIFGGQRLDVWSLKPIREPSIPATQNSEWCKNTIDSFVLARFESLAMAPPKRASRHTLLRRIHYDLTGLPPTPEAAKDFESTADPLAVEQLIDRLLASEQFGIHWARMWLDVARYSDSNGFDWDEFRPYAYRYRDYVIRAFNQDKPYDRFVTEQLAGDELLPGAPQNESEQDALIATGFLRMGPHDNAAKIFNEQDRSRDELLIDLVETTGGALLGMTLSCCRCHDHKFDPLSQADYFRFRACFAGVKFADELPIDLAHTQVEATEHNSAIEAKISELQIEIEAILSSIRTRSSADSESSSQPGDKSDPTESDAKKAKEPKPEELKKLANDSEKQKIETIEKAIEQAKSGKRSLNHAMLMVDDEKPAATYVLAQGDYKSPKEQVAPGILSILNPNELAAAQIVRAGSSGRRTALAQWITSTNNPLTARVMVNRVWLSLMGQGLVRTPGDFGIAGVPPEDPALLDWLAIRFMAEKWSLKKLIRTIMLSATYQQAASFGEPPDGLSYATRHPRRLTAEQLRDSMLAVSGILTNQVSGSPKWPELPREVLEANPAFLDDNETKTKGWYPSPEAEQYCRSIFLVQKRNTRVPLLETLDQPENSLPCQRRAASIVAPQALSLLNSPIAITAARRLADRIEVPVQSQAERIHYAFALTLQRPPSPVEQQTFQQLLAEASWIDAARVLLNVNEFAYVD